jgi:D-amino peptidase
MRILLWPDMEGMSRVVDHRECWPVFPEYWRTGRRAFTDEVVAAAAGLLAGGATEVVVGNGHGICWPNLIAGELPDRVRPWAGLGEDIDGLFEVGRHARCGTADGFVSHTGAPYLANAGDGRLLTESHNGAHKAWHQDGPVLGIVGDAALGRQLDGPLSGTPFLAVKVSSSRRDTKPVHTDAAASAATIGEFAAFCVRSRKERSVPPRPACYRVAISFLDAARSAAADGKHGLRRRSAAVLEIEGADWYRDLDPALGAVQQAAMGPFLAIMGDLTDIQSEEDLNSRDPASVDAARQYFTDWVSKDPPAWRE